MKTKLKWNSSQSAQKEADEAFARMKAAAKAREEAAKKPRKKQDYHAYIKSAAWDRKRQWAFKQLGRKCNVCGSSENLRVHHASYVRLGRERLTDLEVLCDGCHANHHEENTPHARDPLTREFRRIVG